jgi:hypothetical protein
VTSGMSLILVKLLFITILNGLRLLVELVLQLLLALVRDLRYQTLILTQKFK